MNDAREISYPNEIPSSTLKPGWEQDPYLGRVVTLLRVGGFDVLSIQSTLEFKFPAGALKDSPMNPERAAALVIERLLLDIQHEIRPVLTERLRRALAGTEP